VKKVCNHEAVKPEIRIIQRRNIHHAVERIPIFDNPSLFQEQLSLSWGFLIANKVPDIPLISLHVCKSFLTECNLAIMQ